MIMIKKTSDDKSADDLRLFLSFEGNLPIYTFNDELLDDVTLSEETTTDTTFNQEIYDPDVDNRFKNLINFSTLLYGFRFRLLWDSVEESIFLSQNLDYIPLVHTQNNSLHTACMKIGGIKSLEKHMYQDYHIGSSLEPKVKIPQPDDTITSEDASLVRLNLRGMMNAFETRRRTDDDVSSEPFYYHTNEIYFLKLKKDKFFGSGTRLDMYTVIPVLLNKFNVLSLGKLSDLEYVYIPVLV